MPSLDRGGGQKGHHLWLPKSSRLGRAMSPEGPAAGSGPEVPRLPQPGLGAPPARTQAPRHPCRWFVMESPRSYSTPTSAPGDRASPPCVGPLPPPNPHMTIVRFVSGVGNLLGFFPTIMALSVPVFSVFSTCEIDVYGKKRKKKKKNLTYCIKITILCAPRATAFGSGLPTPSPTPLGLPSPGGESVHACGSLVCRAVFYLFVVFLKTQ